MIAWQSMLPAADTSSAVPEAPPHRYHLNHLIPQRTREHRTFVRQWPPRDFAPLLAWGGRSVSQLTGMQASALLPEDTRHLMLRMFPWHRNVGIVAVRPSIHLRLRSKNYPMARPAGGGLQPTPARYAGMVSHMVHASMSQSPVDALVVPCRFFTRLEPRSWEWGWAHHAKDGS